MRRCPLSFDVGAANGRIRADEGHTTGAVLFAFEFAEGGDGAGVAD